MIGNLGSVAISSRLCGFVAFIVQSFAHHAHAQSFEDVTAGAKLHYEQWQPTVPEAPIKESIGIMTGGAATADSNSDGWPDLFVTRYDDSDILFINNGDGTFSDQSIAHGFTEAAPTNGVAWADMDNDGDPDIYLSVTTTSGSPLPSRFRYYENRGSAGYVEIGQNNGAALTSQHGHSGFSIAVGDYDRDGWLDAYTCQWNPRGDNRQSILLRNRGGTFENVTNDAGVNVYDTNKRSFPLNACFSDLDRDRWPDLVIAGDFGTSRLFWNKSGRFTDGTKFAQVGTDENGMGLTIGDYDRDGLFDFFVTSIYDPEPDEGNPWGSTGNRLFRNRGNRIFEDTTETAGVRDGAWGWGTAFIDYDNDTDLDLIMTNGYGAPFVDFGHEWLENPMVLWRNHGDGKFSDVSEEEGIADTRRGKGLLTFDYDRDGDLDVFVANNAGSPVLYRNNSNSDHAWLRILPTGNYSNRDGVGCLVTVKANETVPEQIQEISGGSNYLSASERVCHFGLGDFSGEVESVTIEWPSGITQQFKDIPVNQEFAVEEPASPYHAWVQTHFESDGTESDPSQDPDRDRVVNMIEFATGGDPLRQDQASLFELNRSITASRLVFRKRVLPRGVEVDVEVSSDLDHWISWNDAGFEEIAIVQDSTHSDIQTITLQRRDDIEPSLEWFRLRISID